MCNGRGMIGGWLGGPSGGYDAVDCMDCEANNFTYRVVMRDLSLREPVDITAVSVAMTQEKAVELLRQTRWFKLRWSHAIFMERSDGLRRWIHADEYRPKDQA